MTTAGCLLIPRTCERLSSRNHPEIARSDDDMVKNARARLFGSWEMNWMAYNFAHDVALPGSNGAPSASSCIRRRKQPTADSTASIPDDFKYEITSKEITATNG